MPASAITALHVAPHPDDESIGAIGTLLALRAAGHRVVNLACGLGRPEDHQRRRAEVTEACDRAQFDLVLPAEPIALSRGDDLAAAQREVTALVAQTIEREGAQLVVSPSPHDGHHGHEAVGRGVRDALAAAGTTTPVRWWMWGLWADLPLPTLFSAFDDERLAQAEHVLAGHAGELARNDYATLVRARASANSVLGSERVFGWGQRRRAGAPYAEVLTEAWRDGDGWIAGAPRALDPAEPLAGAEPDAPLGWWLDAPSFRTRLASARAGRAPTSADPPGR